MSKVLIVPDVHCRDFYKEPVKKYIDQVDKVVFLGDYLDPYYYEGFTRENGIKNLGEIIELKNNNPDKVILLLGNHDCQYCDDWLNPDDKCDIRPCSRYDCNPERNKVTRKLYELNKDKFQLLYKIDDVVFSHAGIRNEWLDEYCHCTFDELLKDETKAYGHLWVVGFSRGGDEDFGSCVWNSLNEERNRLPGDLYQVFGHTQLINEGEPFIDENDNWACLDCRRCFIMDTNNKKLELV